MKNILTNKSQQQGVAMIFYLFFLMLIMLVVGGGMTYVSGTVHAQNRRSDWVAAQEYAQGGAVIACDEMNQAFTRTTGTMAQALAAKGYVADTALTNAQNSVYKRTISAPFTNQTVQAQLWIPAGNAPKTAKIVATAKKGKVTHGAIRPQLSAHIQERILRHGTREPARLGMLRLMVPPSALSSWMAEIRRRFLPTEE
jgi:Tfp pilus assembly protein PilX